MKALSYQQVYLQPRLGVLNSRADADLSVEFLGRRFRSCVIPANMSCVVNPAICKWLSENDYPYIMHRFGDTLEFARRANDENWKLISISTGVNEFDKNLLRQIAGEGLRVDWLTLDISHGYCLKMKEMIDFVSTVNWKGDCPFVIAGNVATPEAASELSGWGADCSKCGISGGKSCSTKTQTGFHVPMFTCALECCGHMTGSMPMIIDGGIREPGDIAKALVAAKAAGQRNVLVMAGSIFAACIDAPGANVYDDQGIAKKRYHGSASEAQKGHKKHVEGFQIELPCNGMTYEEYYQHLAEALSSAVSYAGGRSLRAFKDVEWIEA